MSQSRGVTRVRTHEVWIALQIALQVFVVKPSFAEFDIIGGDEVKLGDYYSRTTVALITRTARGSGICTASIIAKDLLVTAAHCVTDVFGRVLPPQSHRIVFHSSVDESSEGDLRAVDGVKVHSTWKGSLSRGKDQGDIAVVHFLGGLPAGFEIATLLPTSKKLKNNQTVTLAGYGVTTMEGGGSGAGVLRRVDTKISIANFGKTEVLLDQRLGRGACHGDSGGPASITLSGKIYLFGVTNRGYPETGPDDCKQFSVYTNINAHRTFVSQASQELRKVSGGSGSSWPR